MAGAKGGETDLSGATRPCRPLTGTQARGILTTGFTRWRDGASRTPLTTRSKRGTLALKKGRGASTPSRSQRTTQEAFYGSRSGTLSPRTCACRPGTPPKAGATTRQAFGYALDGPRLERTAPRGSTLGPRYEGSSNKRARTSVGCGSRPTGRRSYKGWPMRLARPGWPSYRRPLFARGYTSGRTRGYCDTTRPFLMRTLPFRCRANWQND